jgi:hypothetical protein
VRVSAHGVLWYSCLYCHRDEQSYGAISSWLPSDYEITASHSQ